MESKEKRYSEWYDKNNKLYKKFCVEIENIIAKLLDINNIPIHSITSRIKEKESFLEKCKRKEYEDAIDEMMDLAGIRIIAYINSDVQTACELIKKEFIIDIENSVNKSAIMKENEVGYLSHHFIAKLNESRITLPEYSEFEGLQCEIQIRTFLQHAWAEIEHDRNYKFSGELPSEIKRRFYLVAGSLELLDREFQNLSDDIEKYGNDVKKKTTSGDLDIAINSTSLREYIKNSDLSSYYSETTSKNWDKILIDELNQFEVHTLAQLDKIIPENFIEVIKKLKPVIHHVGLIRVIMIINNTKKFFAIKHPDIIDSIPKRIIPILEEYSISKDDLEKLGISVH